MKSLCWKNLALGGALMLAACSSSQTKDSDSADVIPAIADAGTDEVPQPSQEEAGAPPLTENAPSEGEATPPIASAGDTPPDPSALPSAAPEMASAAPPVMDAGTPPSTDPGTTPSLDTTTAPSADLASAAAPSSEPVTPSSEPSTPAEPASTESMSSSASSTATMSGDSYKVRRGDTLMKIAFKLYGDLFKWKHIYDSNKEKIPHPDQISAGLILTVDKGDFQPGEPSGEKYRIKKGDTLGKISDTLYGTPNKWKTLWENNKQLIKNPNKIFAGFYLFYTPGEGGSKGSHAESSQGDQALGDSERTPASTAVGTAVPDASALSSPAPGLAAPASVPATGAGAPELVSPSSSVPSSAAGVGSPPAPVQ